MRVSFRTRAEGYVKEIAVEIKAIKFQGFQRPGSPSAPGGFHGLLPGKLV